jgi:hypothetical protein
MYRLALALLVLAAAGCDGAGPGPPDGGNPIVVQEPPADVTLAGFQEIQVVDLSSTFVHVGGFAVSLTFGVDTDAASVEWVDASQQRLRLRPTRVGTTVVTVTASARGASQSTSFSVLVEPTAVATCPPPQPEGTDDFVPLTAGETWAYDYVWQMGPGHGGAPTQRREGILTHEFLSVECIGVTREATVREHMEGTSFTRSNGAWVASGTFSATRTLTFREDENHRVEITLPLTRTSGPRYVASAPTDTLIWSVGCGGDARVGRGAGLVSSGELCGGSFETQSAVLQRRAP